MDFENRTLEPGYRETETIFDFIWPSGVGTGNLTFWGALVTDSELVGYDKEYLFYE